MSMRAAAPELTTRDYSRPRVEVFAACLDVLAGQGYATDAVDRGAGTITTEYLLADGLLAGARRRRCLVTVAALDSTSSRVTVVIDSEARGLIGGWHATLCSSGERQQRYGAFHGALAECLAAK